MRPLRLELKGFSAFRDPQEISFEGLDLFAISGQTGSGKTSILDAITYALYGSIDRVGKQVGQFVSQGQPRMAVIFEFAVDDERYRVARSTPAAKGQTKVLLERWDGGNWTQAGEGADRVREADAAIRSAVGLDYDAFTRTVLLPQGRFAEFLVGDAKQRRDILTELLGLELFERLAKRNGELKRSAAAEADANARLLETEYAGVTPEAAEEAAAEAKDAAARDGALAGVEAAVRGLAERWAETARAIREAEACGHDAREAAAVAETSARSLEGIAGRISGADQVVASRAKAASEAAKNAGKAEKARAKAEAEWGRAADLGALRAKAEALAMARGELEQAEADLAAATHSRSKLEKALVAAEKALASRLGGAESALTSVKEARGALEEARHADLVAAVRAGVRVGDACPVCGAPVASLPKTPGAAGLEKALAAVAAAEELATAVQAALDRARDARETAERTLASVDRDVAALQKELGKRRGDLAPVERVLAKAIGGALPADPVAVVDGRLARLRELEEAEREAAEGAAEARDEATLAERDRDRVTAELGAERARLEALVAGSLFDRVRAVAGVAVPEIPTLSGTEDADGLRAAAADLAGVLASLASALDRRAATLAESEDLVLAEAARAVEGLVQPAASLEGLLRDLAEERRLAAAAAATTAQRVELLRVRLENARAVAAMVTAGRARTERFEMLAKELRADRIVAFLQVEALQVLAAAGSKHLATLSSSRYRLEFEGDEFFVVDTWNGEERRSARTLSGGETFLASLALALALSEQVGSLSVTEKARLDSLFLDEGFGTLDPETLEVVVEAIEQLGGDGRMVGVITHVLELAIRLPARIEVEKSPRGSQARVVTG